MSEDEFLVLLKHHDWFYQYSDDHSVWRKGQREADEIRRLIKENPQLDKVRQRFVQERFAKEV